MKLFALTLLALSLLLPHTAFALERFPIVSTLELENLLEERTAGTTDFLLINTLDRIIGDDATIPGSVNIPVHELARSDLLPTDRSAFLVFY
jgi:hypothetical protein